MLDALWRHAMLPMGRTRASVEGNTTKVDEPCAWVIWTQFHWQHGPDSWAVLKSLGWQRKGKLHALNTLYARGDVPGPWYTFSFGSSEGWTLCPLIVEKLKALSHRVIQPVTNGAGTRTQSLLSYIPSGASLYYTGKIRLEECHQLHAFSSYPMSIFIGSVEYEGFSQWY